TRGLAGGHLPWACWPRSPGGRATVPGAPSSWTRRSRRTRRTTSHCSCSGRWTRASGPGGPAPTRRSGCLARPDTGHGTLAGNSGSATGVDMLVELLRPPPKEPVAGTMSVHPDFDAERGAAERSFVSSLPPASVLPREFDHSALQSLMRQGLTHGSVTAEAVREACEAADVAARRLKTVLRSIEGAGSKVQAPVTAPAPRAKVAAAASGRSSATATVEVGDDAEPKATKTARKTAAKSSTKVAGRAATAKKAP